MTTQEILLNVMEEILGLDVNEMKKNLDTDLLENGLIDSLGYVSLINALSEKLNIVIDITDLSPDDLTTVNKLTSALDRLKGEKQKGKRK